MAVTLNVAWSLPEALLAPMDFAPPAVLDGISTVVTIFPVLSELVDDNTTPDMVKSIIELGPNPEPRTVIGVPGGPWSGLTLKEDVIVNVRVRVVPIMTLYVPAATAGTIIGVLKDPVELAPTVDNCWLSNVITTFSFG